MQKPVGKFEIWKIHTTLKDSSILVLGISSVMADEASEITYNYSWIKVNKIYLVRKQML